MGFFNQLGDIGTNIIDSVGDIIGATGDNAETAARANAAKVSAAEATVEIAKRRANADIAAKEQQQKVLRGSIIAIIALLSIIVLAKVLPPLIRELK